ncbi:hypothetical protein BN79_021 [Yersinia phage phiR2-01]|uniref:Phage protein n=1 Tax=Yersinia phage phiR2-01 TaxID=1206557 RepID=I7LGY5_9CAUD|nr:hypothetical protein BN79_021 [Yersinia phage phiR2-01]CCI88449.1 hypothetical protein BN79_021 [Yersinia phage phiR2-01]
MFFLALYLIAIGVLVTKYHTWAPKTVIKVALFIIPVPIIIIALGLTVVAGKVTKTNVSLIADELQQASDRIEDILKDEA